MTQQRSAPIRFAGFLVIWAFGLLPHLVQWEYAGLLRTLAWLGAAGLFFFVAQRVAVWSGAGGLGTLGLTGHRGWGRNLLLGLLFGLALTALNYGARWALGRFAVEGLMVGGQGITLTLWALVNALYSSLWEELLNRGYLLRVLPGGLPPGAMALTASLCFSAFHITKAGSPLNAWVFWFFSGLALVIPYLITRSLWFSLGLHWGQNFLVYALFEQPGVLRLTWHESYPALANWTGVGALLLLLPLIWLVSRYWLARTP